MSDLNSVVIVGRLTNDAKLEYTNSGLAICSFSIANNKDIKKGDKWEKYASFFDVTLFGKHGEAVSKYLTKGGQVAIQGEIKQDRWEKDGKNHSKIKIIANNIQLLGGKSQSEGPLAEPVTREAAHDGGFADDISF